MPSSPAKPRHEPLIIIPGDLDQARGYRIMEWRGYPNYECIYCQYATLWVGKMEKHQAIGEHPWAYPGQNPRKPGDPGDGNTEPEY